MRARFVAEVGANHRGELERALSLVDAAADAGCASVAFQQLELRAVYAPEALRARPELLARGARELPAAFHVALARRAREREIAFACTPFQLAAVERLAPHVDAFQLDSCQLLWRELLALVARTKKPVVLTTGMATLMEVRAAVETLRKNGCGELTLLHGVSLHPTPAGEANLAAIETLRKTFGGAVGWFDHTRDPQVIERAVRRFGAATIAFQLDLDGRGDDYGRSCWLPGEIAWVIQNLERSRPGELQRSQPCDGDGRKEPRPAEREERAWRIDPADGRRPLLATRRQLARNDAA